MSPRFRVLLEVVIDHPTIGAAVAIVEQELNLERRGPSNLPGGLVSSSVISAVRLDPRGPAT